MLNDLLTQLRSYRMLEPGDRVICAVSGGADSMALLWAMYLLRDKLSVTLEAAHFNHGLRGEESDRDERFVREFCDRFDIPLHVGKGTVVAGKKGLEASAREARYAFFDTLCGKIATAHTADDNAETMLMHLIRGTGLKGLGGIAPVNGNRIRPMLHVTRRQVLAFLAEYHITHIEDSSNATDAFLRNRIRHRILPLLQEENPKICENLSATAARLRQDEQALETLAAIHTLPDITTLRTMVPALRYRCLSAFLKRTGVKEPEAAHIRAVDALVFSDNPSARAALPGGITLQRCYDRLEVTAEQPSLSPLPLSIPGKLELPALGIAITCAPADSIVNTTNVFTVAPISACTLRSRLSGDRIRLPGGTKTVKKLFADRKIPAAQRMQVPILADSEGILGIYGIGVNLDRAARQLPALQIRFEPIDSSGKL